MNKKLLLGIVLAFSACLGGSASPMKARVIQQLYALDTDGRDKSFQWTLHELQKCDPSLDIVVLPEFCEIPGIAPEGLLEMARRNGPLLREACAETAKRCSALVFAGVVDYDCEVPRNAILVYGRDGSLIGKYFKQHLTAGEWKRRGLDKSYTEEWSEPTIMDIEGVRYAFLTCYDFYFYENFANIARWKPDIIIGSSHQRSDTFRALNIINAFLAYNTGAYLVRASVSMGKKSKLGGCSCVVAPTGEILGNLYSKVKSMDITFDPKEKYLKPAGYGNPPALHSEYIEIGRRPWKYRPGGSAIVPALDEAPPQRSVVYSDDLGELGAAVATGIQEIGFSLDAAQPWEAKLEGILKKLSCHAIMNIHLKGNWDEDSKKRLSDIVFAYDASGHVYYTVD